MIYNLVHVKINLMKFTQILWLLSALLITQIAFAATTNIINLRIYPNKTTRVVFDMNTLATYQKFSLRHPARIVLDFNNTSKKFALNLKNLNNTPIKNIRFSKRAHHILRIVFDLHNRVKSHIFQLKPSGKHGYRTVLDLTPLQHSSNKIKKTLQTIVKSYATHKNKLRDIIIVLDPGHGGRDPGATGPGGTHEKNITLSIGLYLRRDLQKIHGIKVYMTRTRDVYPTLSQRLFLARRVKADLFVSIHADAYKNRTARGATVFALSQGRATSEAARWLADRENKSELLGGVNLADKSYMLSSVLMDLSQTATIGSSLKLGKDAVQQLHRITRMHSHRVQQASLYVLTSPSIPAILVETGFISNPHEELLLRKASHRRQIAKAIAQGIKNYLLANPIQNTFFTASIFGTKYIVQRGDSISKIAVKFKVGATKLEQINQLKSNKLFIGQVIRIPSKHD